MADPFAYPENPPVDTQAEDSVAPGAEGVIPTVDLTSSSKREASDEDEQAETTKKPKLMGTGHTKTAETAAAEAALVESASEPVDGAEGDSPLPSPRFEGVDPAAAAEEEVAEEDEDEEDEEEATKGKKEKKAKKSKATADDDDEDEADSDAVDSDEEIDEDELAFLDQTAIIPEDGDESGGGGSAGGGRRSSRRGAAKVDYVKANLELGGNPDEED